MFEKYNNTNWAQYFFLIKKKQNLQRYKFPYRHFQVHSDEIFTKYLSKSIKCDLDQDSYNVFFIT